MPVYPVSVCKRTGGRPSAVDDPEGGWSWRAMAEGLEPGEYVVKVVEASEVEVPDDGRSIAPDSPISAAAALAISAATEAVGKVAAGYDKLVAAQGTVIDRLAKLNSDGDPDEGGTGKLIMAGITAFAPFLAAAAAAQGGPRPGDRPPPAGEPGR